MYKKLIKNFIFKNISIFILIFFSLSISIFWFIFSDSLTKNFLQSIEKDSKTNLWWDFVIDIRNSEPQDIENFLKEFKYKNDVYITKEYSIASSVELDNILWVNLIFYWENYPFYSDFDFKNINSDWKVLISKDFYENNNEIKEIKILWNNYKVKWIYENLPSSAWSFFDMENILIPIEELWNTSLNEKNSLIDKKYFLKLKDEIKFDEIKDYLENNPKLENFRVRNYVDGWDRFEDLIKTLRSYINYIVLFSFILTITIIFLALSSFFIKERKDISVLRLLWMTNKQFIILNVILFSFIWAISFFSSFILAKLWFGFIKNIDYSSSFNLLTQSLIKALFILFIIITSSISIAIYKFIKSEALKWFSEDFFSKITKKESVFLIILIYIISFILSLMLDFTILKSIFSSFIFIAFILVFFIITKFILKNIYKKSFFLREKNFYLYDSIRSTIKPGNLSLILNLSFFVVFFIILFVSVLFWNFYDRLKINLDTDKNFFALNIDADTYINLEQKYKDDSYSVIKWRILKINWIDREKYLENDWFSGRRFSREFNITDNSLSDLKIIKWKDLTKWGVSVDYNFSKDLRVWVWDKITFLIYGLEKELEVVNIRESIDYSINPFFYFQVDKEELSSFPKQYFLSTYLGENEKKDIKKYLYDLSEWNVFFIEVDKILLELKEISKKILLVIQSLFVYISIFSILTIIVVSLFFREFQKQKSKLYFVIWTTNKQNKKRVFYEYSFLSTIMLVLSIIVSSASSYIILYQNNFIGFSFMIYFISLSSLILIYFIILFSISFSLKRFKVF